MPVLAACRGLPACTSLLPGHKLHSYTSHAGAMAQKSFHNASLSVKDMREREAFAYKLFRMRGAPVGSGGCLDLLQHYLYRCVWIDSKVFYVCPSTQQLWTQTDPSMTAAEAEGLKMVKLVYYIAVNAILGPVYIELVTGTSEHEADPHHHSRTR